MDQRANTGRTELVSMAMVALWALLWVSVSQGQTTSITSSGLNTHVSHGAGIHNYDITGGTRPGNGTNLFHSFGDFSVGTHDVARFLNDTNLPTTNILSRVTGGHVSNIFGQINTANFPGANLYLINPAGVLFGPTATLNVSGSVHISTADYLRLADGLRFNAIPGPQDMLLSQASVVAFGFLNPHPRPITDNGLQSGVGSPVLSLIGGDVTVSGGSLRASQQINLVSLASRGEVRVGASGEPSVSGFGQLGTVTLSNHASVLASNSATTAGTVVLRAGKLVVDNARIGGGTISIEARESALFRNSPRALDTQGVKGGGKITVDAGQIQLTKSNILASGSPQGGTVVLNTPGRVSMDNSQIDTGASGAGAVAGKINMTAGDSVRLSNGTILTSTLNTVISTGSGGTGGDITFNVRNFTATDSIVSTAVRDGGSGGAVTIQGLDGSGHFANTVALTNTTINTSSAGLPGFPGPPRTDGGPITVHADQITINQSTLNALSNETTGGPISLISTNQIATQNSSFITASFFGSGGTVDLRAGTSIQLINTSLNAHGSNFKGGDITVAGHKVSLMGSTLDVSSGGIFDAGTINLTGSNGIALNGTVLLADSVLSPPFPISSHPNGGTIHMDAGAQFTSNQSTISAHSILGNGGFIRIEANKVGISNTTMTTSVTGGPQTTAGTITLNGHNITLDNSQLLSTATEGHGGTITIQTHEFRRDASSLLDVRGGGGGGFVIVKPLR